MIHRTAVLAVLALAATSHAFAQNPAPAATPANAAAPAARKSRNLFDYRTELGLTDAQIARIRSAARVLQDKLAELDKTNALSDVKIQRLVESNGDIQEIRAELRKIADAQVEARVSDIETARAVDKIMSADQLKKWREIQAANRARAK